MSHGRDRGSERRKWLEAKDEEAGHSGRMEEPDGYSREKNGESGWVSGLEIEGERWEEPWTKDGRAALGCIGSGKGQLVFCVNFGFTGVGFETIGKSGALASSNNYATIFFFFIF